MKALGHPDAERTDVASWRDKVGNHDCHHACRSGRSYPDVGVFQRQAGTGRYCQSFCRDEVWVGRWLGVLVVAVAYDSMEAIGQFVPGQMCVHRPMGR